MTIDTNKLVDWLKQPSTIKFIVTAAGAVGWYIDAAALDKIIGIVVLAIGVINGFYDQNPRKPEPKNNTIEDLDAAITTEQLIELVRIRKARIAEGKK
jgi:hypothetical protein